MPSVKYFLKSVLKPLIYRYPPIMLAPERLMLWQQTLIETSGVDGDVVEVGCYLGGTAAVAARMMRNLGDERPYRVYDTFSVFTKEQWSTDTTQGVFSDARDDFSSNSPELTRWSWTGMAARTSRSIKGISPRCQRAICLPKFQRVLLDVDLTEPIYESMLASLGCIQGCRNRERSS